jgi:hypothetical protein
VDELLPDGDIGATAEILHRELLSAAN